MLYCTQKILWCLYDPTFYFKLFNYSEDTKTGDVNRVSGVKVVDEVVHGEINPNSKYVIKQEAQTLSFLILLQNHDEKRHRPSCEYTSPPLFHPSWFSSDVKSKNARGGA